MIEKKNKVKVEIESCAMCPNVTLKSVKEEQKHIMFCQTETSCIRLREAWGNYPIPDWCPRLKQNQSKVMRGMRAKIPGIIDDAIGV